MSDDDTVLLLQWDHDNGGELMSLPVALPNPDPLRELKLSPSRPHGHSSTRKQPHASSTSSRVTRTMAGKRKRHRPGQGNRGEAKRQRTSTLNGSRTAFVVRDALLVQYYPRVLSLREYLLSKLPPTSKIRRKKISTVGRKPGQGGSHRDQVLAAALDHILIGISRDVQVSQEERWQQWTSFSQRADTSASTLANLSGVELFSQSEVCVCRCSNSPLWGYLLCYAFSNAARRLSISSSGSSSPSHLVGVCSICYAKVSERMPALVPCTVMRT